MAVREAALGEDTASSETQRGLRGLWPWIALAAALTVLVSLPFVIARRYAPSEEHKPIREEHKQIRPEVVDKPPASEQSASTPPGASQDVPLPPLVSVRRWTLNAPTDWAFFFSKESTVAAPPRLVLTLGTQQRTIPVASDTMLISYLATQAWGADSRMSISLNDTNRALIRFELPRVASARALTKAELLLEVSPGGLPPKEPFAVTVHRVKDPWTEALATWNNAPAFDPAIVATFLVPIKQASLNVDITSLVRQWIEGAPNHGLLIKVLQKVVDTSAPE